MHSRRWPASRCATAESRAKFAIELPAGWSVQTPFAAEEGKPYTIDNPERRFDRPTGWIIAGDIGVRIDRIADTRVVVAAPKSQDVRRQNMLALMNWTLPHLKGVVKYLPGEILIVSADDPFWRGVCPGRTRSTFTRTGRLSARTGPARSARDVSRRIRATRRIEERQDRRGARGILQRGTAAPVGHHYPKQARQDPADAGAVAEKADKLEVRRASGPVTAKPSAYSSRWIRKFAKQAATERTSTMSSSCS